MLCSMLAARMSPGGGMSTASRARNTTVPNTRRIGWAKLAAEYWRGRRRIGKAAIPGRRPAHAREPKRWTTNAVSAMRSRDEQEHQQSVIGTAAGRDRRDGQPGVDPSCTGMRAPVSAWATGASVSITTPGNIPASRHSSANSGHGGERPAIDLPRLRRPCRCAAGRGRRCRTP